MAGWGHTIPNLMLWQDVQMGPPQKYGTTIFPLGKPICNLAFPRTDAPMRIFLRKVHDSRTSDEDGSRVPGLRSRPGLAGA